MKRAILGLTTGLLFLFVPAQVIAQKGLFAGGHLNGTSYSPDAIDQLDEDSESYNGYGFGAIVGYGFGALAPYGKLSWASMNEGDSDNDNAPDLIHLDVGARLSLPLGALVPYINAAYTFQRIQQDLGDGTLKYNGNGITGGAGLQLVFGALALDAALNVTSGNFSQAEFNDQTQDIDADNTTVRFDLGLVFFTGTDDDEN